MRTLAYPEFTLPASLVILIGAAFVAANLLLHQHNAISWAIPGYLIVAGLCMARRNWIGTALLVIGLTGLLIIRIPRYFEHGVTWNFYEVIRLLLNLLILASLASAVLSQINYFKRRSAKANSNGQDVGGQPVTPPRVRD